jgi:hypothetical protein
VNNREGQIPEEQVEAIIEQGRAIGRAPAAVRARLLARARATIASLGHAEAAAPIAAPSASPGWRRFRWALAAGGVLAFASAGAAAAFHAWSSNAADVAAAQVSTLDVPADRRPAIRPPAIAAPPRAALPAPQPAAGPRLQRPARAPSPQESYAAEVRLLQRARSEYAAHDYSGALALVTEHARQFPGGRLTEEREALRVRSLAAAGRKSEAHLAFSAFARRFPHSVLLSRLQQAASDGDDAAP